MKKLLILFLLLFTLTACSPENTGTPTPTQYFYDLTFRENIGYDLENGTPIYTDYMSTARQKISSGGLFIRNADFSPDVNAHHVLFWSKNNYYLGYQNFPSTDYEGDRYLGDISTVEITLPEHADKFSIIASKMSTSELIPHELTLNSIVSGTNLSYQTLFNGVGLQSEQHTLDTPIVELNDYTLREVFEDGTAYNYITANNGYYNTIDLTLTQNINNTITSAYTDILSYNANDVYYNRVKYDLTTINDIVNTRLFTSNGLTSSYSNSNNQLQNNIMSYQFSHNVDTSYRLYIEMRYSVLSIDTSRVLTIKEKALVNQTTFGISSLTVTQMDYYYSLYNALKNSDPLPNEVENGFYTNEDVVIYIGPLITNKQHSPMYNTTFDLMTNEQIKLQMDYWVENGLTPKLATLMKTYNLSEASILNHYHTYLRLLEKTDVTLEEIGTYVPMPYDNTNLTLPFDYNAYGETYNNNTNGVEYINGTYYYAQYFTKYDISTLMKEFNYHSFDDIFKNNNYLDPNNVDAVPSYSALISVTEQDNGFYKYLFDRAGVGTPYSTYEFFIEIHNLEYEPVPFPTIDTHNVFLIAKWNGIYITDTLGDLTIRVQSLTPPTIQIEGTGEYSIDEDFFPTEYHTLFYNQTPFDSAVRQINVTYSEVELINDIYNRTVSLDMYMFYGPYFDLYNLQEEDVNEWWSIYQDVLVNDIVYVELDEPIYTPIEEFTALNIERLIGYHQDLVLEEELTEEELIPLAFASGEDLDPLFMNAGIGGFGDYIYLTSNKKSDYITLWDNVSYNYLHYTTFLNSTYEYVNANIDDWISRYERIDSYTTLDYTEFQDTVAYYILNVYPPTPSDTSGFLNDQLEEWGLNTTLFKTIMIVVFMIAISIILALFGAKQSILILANTLLLIIFAIIGWISMWLFIPIVLLALFFIIMKFKSDSGGTDL